MRYGFGLQNLAEQLELALCVGRVGDLWINLCTALQNWLHVLEDAYSGFPVISAHAAFANTTERQVRASEVQQSAVHSNSARSGAFEDFIHD